MVGKNVGLVFNPSDVPYMDQTTGCLIDGSGWGVVDLSDEWTASEIEAGNLIIVNTASAGSSDVSTDAFIAMQQLEEAQQEVEAIPAKKPRSTKKSDTAPAVDSEEPSVVDTDVAPTITSKE